MIAGKPGSNLFAALIWFRRPVNPWRLCLLFAVCRSLKGISYRDPPGAPSKPGLTREVFGPHYQRKLSRAISSAMQKSLTLVVSKC
jgi:hypothetical protein